MGHSADKACEMKTSVIVNVKAEILPFSISAQEGTVQIGFPAQGSTPTEPVIVEPSTLTNRIITSVPSRLLRP
jgi:hypothetical protein